MVAMHLRYKMARSRFETDGRWRRVACRFAGSALIVLALCLPTRGGSIAPGMSQFSANLGGLAMTNYAYRPDCPNPSSLLVFHGLNRNAERYRDYARPLGD